MNALPTRISCGWNRLNEPTKLSLITAGNIVLGLTLIQVFR